MSDVVDMMDISSQEEDNKAKHNSNNKKQQQQQHQAKIHTMIKAPKQAANTGNLPPPPNLNLARFEAIPVNELPVIKNIRELVLEYPHMQSDPITGQPNCTDALNKFNTEMKTLNHEIEAKVMLLQDELSTLGSTPSEIQKKHFESANTWQLDVFKDKLRRLQVPQLIFHDPKSSDEELFQMFKMPQEDLVKMLRSEALKLPIASAPLESDLLRESGTWSHLVTKRMYNFPPCMWGPECITYSKLVGRIQGLDKPMILTQFMFEEEYTALIQGGRSGANIPPRPCVLCCRDSLADWIVYLRAEKLKGTTIRFQNPEKEIHQFYRNLQNCENGYDSNFMLPVKIGEPIIESIVTLNSSLLRCDTLINGRRRIDQSALLWKHAKLPEPKSGETMKNF